jgi:hypothetical protein
MPAGRGVRLTARRLVRSAVTVAVGLIVVATLAFDAPTLADPGPGSAGPSPPTVTANEPTDLGIEAVALLEAADRGGAWTLTQPVAFDQMGQTATVRPVAGAAGWWETIGSRLTGSHDQLEAATTWLTTALGFLAALVGFVVVVFTFVWWPVRRLRRPRVAVKPLTVAPSGALSGEHLAGLLANELSSTTSGSSLRRVSDAAAGSGVDLARSVGGNLAWLGPVFAKLSLRKVLVVCGDAWAGPPAHKDSAADGKAQVSLTVSVTDQQGRVESRSFPDEKDGISAGDLLQAQVPLAGAWLTDRLQRSRATKRGRGAAWFGTTEWWSWGRFRQGVWYGDHDRTEDAEECYREAISSDVRNAAAWLNLAALHLVAEGRSEKLPRDPQRKRKQLLRQMSHALELAQMADLLRQRARPRLRPRRPMPADLLADPHDPLWYRVRTVEIVARLNRAALLDQQGSAEADGERQRASALALLDQQGSAEADGERQRASALALQLVTELARMQRFFEREHWGRRRRERLDDLHQLVDTTEDYAVALLAASIWRPGLRLTADPHARLNRPDSLWALANLAFERTSQQEVWLPGVASPRPIPREPDQVLQLLAGLRLDPRVDVSERAPHPWPHDAISPRAHYNLACLYARASKDASLGEAALEHLRRGVADSPKRARWAREDPELEPLYGGPLEEKFLEILHDREPGSAPQAPATEVWHAVRTQRLVVTRPSSQERSRRERDGGDGGRVLAGPPGPVPTGEGLQGVESIRVGADAGARGGERA